MLDFVEYCSIPDQIEKSEFKEQHCFKKTFILVGSVTKLTSILPLSSAARFHPLRGYAVEAIKTQRSEGTMIANCHGKL